MAGTVSPLPTLRAMQLDKKIIKERFGKSLSTYDQQSVVQDRVAKRLLDLLAKGGCPAPRRVLEIGCCTGLLTRRIIERYPDIVELWCNDLVKEAEKPLREKMSSFTGKMEFIAGDVEKATLPSALDLVISSSTFHWIVDLKTFFTKMNRCVRPGGHLAFAMYGPDNLYEIKEISGVGLAYPDPITLFRLSSGHFQVISYLTHRECLHFTDVRDLLNHLRQTGVNALDKTVWSPGKLNSFINEYRSRFKDEQGVRVTYHPIYFLLRRP